jgi:hypothetical protein
MTDCIEFAAFDHPVNSRASGCTPPWSACATKAIPVSEPVGPAGRRRTAAHRPLLHADGAACHTLQTTALINEAYLKLVNQAQTDWQNRAQFLEVSPPV